MSRRGNWITVFHNAEEFKKAICSAKERFQTAATLLDTNGVSADDALPSVLCGWRNAQSAVNLLTKDIESEIPERLTQDAQEKNPNTEIEKIEDPCRRFIEKGCSSITPREIRRSNAALRQWIRAVEVWTKERFPTPIRRLAARPIPWMIFGIFFFGIVAFIGHLYGQYFGYGVQATYFEKENFSGKRYEKSEKGINHNWRRGSPSSEIPKDHWSARWEGCLKVKKGERFFLVAGADDNIWVYADGRLLIDNGGGHAFKTKAATSALGPGLHPIRVEYTENISVARANLKWKAAKRKEKLIPLLRYVKPGYMGCPDKIIVNRARKPKVKKRRTKPASSKKRVSPKKRTGATQRKTSSTRPRVQAVGQGKIGTDHKL